ncbi:mannitol dehydrogenase family protein [Micromonospora rifamycinica]|uniref:mannitol dehydrogenase family protein n=1 Tax=Micromonospora rifamycinica TaxID=291594 RepID=UPI00340BBFD3
MSELDRTAVLNRSAVAALAAEVRPGPAVQAAATGIVHLGLGAFARSHVFDFTADAVEAGGGDWGVLAVAPRSAATVAALRRQQLLSSVLIRGVAEDRIRVNGLLRDARCAAEEPAAVVAALADPAVRVVTLTITEAGYRVDPVTGVPRPDDAELANDLAALGRGIPDPDRVWRTAPGLLLAGLLARYRAGAAPVALVSCDNLVGNGAVLAAAVRGGAERIVAGAGDAARGGLLDWLADRVTFPDTVVDRITPASTEADREQAARLLGVRDEAVVVGEPYRQWAVVDDFPAGRPAWELAGVRLVDDVAPYSAVKLRLLNAAHSLLAEVGLLLGCETVAAALDRSVLADLAGRYLRSEAQPALDSPLDLTGYVETMLARFGHPRLAHRLDQIAVDGSQKLAQRIVPTIRVTGTGSRGLLVVAAWGVRCRRRVLAGVPLRDPRAAALAGAVTGADPAAGLLELLAPDLAADAGMRSALTERMAGLDRDPAGYLRSC